jgi:hypothetical protein
MSRVKIVVTAPVVKNKKPLLTGLAGWATILTEHLNFVA